MKGHEMTEKGEKNKTARRAAGYEETAKAAIWLQQQDWPGGVSRRSGFNRHDCILMTNSSYLARKRLFEK